MRNSIIISGLFLITGIIIYYLFNTFLYKNGLITTFIRNYVPDLFWSISFYLFTVQLSRKTFKWYKIINSFYVLIIGIVFELLQLYHLVPGTYDLFDIFIYALGIIFANLIEIFMRRIEYEKN